MSKVIEVLKKELEVRKVSNETFGYNSLKQGDYQNKLMESLQLAISKLQLLEQEEKMNEFEKELTILINRHSQENGSDTPDFILAKYLFWCLQNFNEAVNHREKWYGRERKQGSGKSTLKDVPPPEEANTI